MAFETLSVADAKKLIADEDPTVIDIRDPDSYAASHIDGAQHAEDIDMEKFLAESDKEKPLLLYCYHGFTSQNAAQFFDQHGFTRVYSMDGGYEGWAMAGTEVGKQGAN